MIKQQEDPKDTAILCGAMVCLKGNLMGGPETKKLGKILEEIVLQGTKKLIIDLSDVEWINASGVSTLVICQKSLKQVEGQLWLINPSASVKKVLKLAKLEEALQILDSANKILQALKK